MGRRATTSDDASGDLLGEDSPDYMVGVHGGTVLIDGEEQVYTGEFAAEQ